VIDGFVARGDTIRLTPNNLGLGIWFADYEQDGLVITNADIQGTGDGIECPSHQGNTTFTVENSYLRNGSNLHLFSNAQVGGLGAAAGMSPKKAIIQNVKFDSLPGLPLQNINMDFDYYGPSGNNTPNFIQKDQAFVYSYNQNPNDNFQVFYTQQAADFVVPTTTGSPPLPLIGAPVGDVGLTNAQLVAKYPNGTTIEGQFYATIAVAGAIAPAATTTRPEIVGLLAAVAGNQPVIASVSAAPNPATIGQSVVLTVAATDPNDNALTFGWNFGDGASGTGNIASHVYAAAGSYSAVVTVVNSAGAQATANITVVVAPGAPPSIGGAPSGPGNGGLPPATTGGGGGGNNGPNGAASVPLIVAHLRGVSKFAAKGHDSVSLSGTPQNFPGTFKPAGQNVTLNVGGAIGVFTLNAHGLGRSASGNFTLRLVKPKKSKTSLTESATFSARLTGKNWWNVWNFDPSTSLKNTSIQMIVTLQLGGITYTDSVQLKENSKAHSGATFRK